MSAPLAKVDEIVILSGDNNKLTSDVTRLLAEIPASVHALTGVDLSKVRRVGYRRGSWPAHHSFSSARLGAAMLALESMSTAVLILAFNNAQLQHLILWLVCLLWRTAC